MPCQRFSCTPVTGAVFADKTGHTQLEKLSDTQNVIAIRVFYLCRQLQGLNFLYFDIKLLY